MFCIIIERSVLLLCIGKVEGAFVKYSIETYTISRITILR